MTGRGRTSEGETDSYCRVLGDQMEEIKGQDVRTRFQLF